MVKLAQTNLLKAHVANGDGGLIKALGRIDCDTYGLLEKIIGVVES